MATVHSLSEIKGLFDFFHLCGKLKHLKRTGWVNHDVKDPESVAGHMYRMALMSFLFQGVHGEEGGGNTASLDRERCMRMALVHDLAESIVGDITPHDGVTKTEKYQREFEAMEHIKILVPPKEYEDGTTPEAIVVKDLDRFDMIFQAFEYEKAQNQPFKLQQFFDSTKDGFKHPTIKKWVEELVHERNSKDEKKTK